MPLVHSPQIASCAGCHTLLDAPGCAYTPFDPLGRRLLADEQGRPFGDDGSLVNVDFVFGRSIAG